MRGASLLIIFSFAFVQNAFAASLADTISSIKPSIVAIGTFQKTRNPQYVYKGTGFIVGNGRQVITNSHLIPSKLDHENREILAVFSGEGKRFKEIKNEDLWRRLDHLLARHRVRFTHVRGHAGHPENERCDTLAVAAYQRYL